MNSWRDHLTDSPAESEEKLRLWLKNDIYKLWSARNYFLGGGPI